MLRRPRLSRQYLCWDFPHYTSPKAERRVGGLPQDKASPRPAVELYHSAPRTHSVGICASDLKCYLGAPVIPGHEVGGEGANEKYGLALGDQVVSEQIVPCQQCRDCRRGQYWMCQVHDIHGAHLSPHCYPIAIDMLAKGLLPMDQILTHRLPLENFQEGIDLVAGDRSIKMSLAP